MVALSPLPVNPGARNLCVRSTLAAACAQPLGASIAINGVCLTLVRKQIEDQSTLLNFEVSEESLKRSTLGQLTPQSMANLELAMSLGERLGGHWVSGHVDATAVVCKIENQGDFVNVSFATEPESSKLIAPFLVEKGSIAVNGVSLTINGVCDGKDFSSFSVMLIPHTLMATNLNSLKVGSKVNLEADLMAKYVNRYKSYAEALHV